MGNDGVGRSNVAVSLVPPRSAEEVVPRDPTREIGPWDRRRRRFSASFLPESRTMDITRLIPQSCVYMRRATPLELSVGPSNFCKNFPLLIEGQVLSLAAC